VTYLSKDDIFKADDLPTRDVDVPEWGGIVRIRALDGTGRGEYDASLQQERPDGTYGVDLRFARAKLASLCIVDEDGGRLFNEFDIGRLGQKSAAALDRVATAAAELSGLTATAVKDAAGNSEAALSGGSGSDSPDS
jgi:hypothetical protein